MNNELEVNDKGEVLDPDKVDAIMQARRNQSLIAQVAHLRSLGYTEESIGKIFELNDVKYEPGLPVDLRQETAESLKPQSVPRTNSADEDMREEVRNLQLRALGEDMQAANQVGVTISQFDFAAAANLGNQLANDFAKIVNDTIGAIQGWKMNAEGSEKVLDEDEAIYTDEEMERQEQFAKVCLEAEDLFMRKNREYGNAIKYTGAVGCVTVMTGDIAKLRNLLLYKLEDLDLVDFANVRDKFMDVLVQAVIGIMMLDNDNVMGEE